MRKILFVCIMAAAAATTKASRSCRIGSISLTFDGDKMTVTMNNGTSAKTFDLNAFNKVTFDETPVSVAGTTVEKAGIQFAYDGESISVRGLKKAAAAVIYNANGAVMDSRKAWDGNRLSVASLPEGMYLLNVEGVAYKFLKK